MKKVLIKNPNFQFNKQHFERVRQVSMDVLFKKKKSFGLSFELIMAGFPGAEPRC